MVSDSFDAADNWIAERVGPDDIVVTADIPLADRSIKAGASVIGSTGVPFTPASIGMAMANRELLCEPARHGGDHRRAEADGPARPLALPVGARRSHPEDKKKGRYKVISCCRSSLPCARWRFRRGRRPGREPIRLIAPFAPGGGGRYCARLVGASCRVCWGSLCWSRASRAAGP